MRHRSARSWFFTSAAIGSALVWGAAEFLALQWACYRERAATGSRFRI
jgi:hypothetical protein